MKYTIQPITSRTFEDRQTNKKTTLPGFAFMDECNHCIIIVYGTSNRDKANKVLKQP